MAARRRPVEPPSLVIKQFTSNEITRDIAKLHRRIEEVKALGTDQVSYNDQRVSTAQENIRTAVLEIFGERSPQYDSHRYHQIWHGGMGIGMPEYEYQRRFVEGIPQTVTMLEGLIAWLEEKLSELGEDTTVRIKASFDGLDLHPRIADASADVYRDGHYHNAVLNASIALVNFVKERSRCHDLDGAPLMRKVFSKNDPILAFNDLTDQVGLDHQEGMMHLFEGAVLGLRNPRAHALLDDSPEDALECIALLSFLAKQVERTQRRK